jgi:hypothetical protein
MKAGPMHRPVEPAAVMSDELCEAFAEHERNAARLAAMVAEFDAAQLWDLDDATSMVAWMRDHLRMSGRDAQRFVTLAKKTSLLPATYEGWASGDLSMGQVQSVLHHVGKKLALFAEHEAEVVPTLVPLSLLDTETVMRNWRAKADAADGGEPGDETEPASTLQLSAVGDRHALNGDLNADDGAIVAAALRVAESRDDEDESRTPSERKADALTDICRFFLDNQTKKTGARHRPHVNMIVNLDDWSGGVAGGNRLPMSVLERYCCDSAVHRVITNGRAGILDVGTATRVLTAAMWTALVIRDGHCRFAGCDRPATWCDGHHIQWVSKGGPTRLDNLVLLCRRHHKKLHKPGWHAKLLPDGTFEVVNPDGLTRTSHPPGTLWSG